MKEYTVELHELYKKGIEAFYDNYVKSDVALVEQIDSFCRMCALKIWTEHNVSVDCCNESLGAIYTFDNSKPNYSIEETKMVMNSMKKNGKGIKTPSFYAQIVDFDLFRESIYSRIFVEGLRYILLMFTLIDDRTTETEIESVTGIIKVLSSYADNKGVKQHDFDVDMSKYVTEDSKTHVSTVKITENYKKSELSALERLNSLIGLNKVKDEINAIVNFAKVQEMRKQRNLPLTEVSYHLVFTGNPGTGKTTVARLVAEIYKDLGILSKGHLVEADRADLVAGYVGQTAIKTKEVLDKAKGGVLFIDEAYSLSGKGGQDYGQEAIDTILKTMEDERDDLAIIVAGYDDLMHDFIASNPGLQSRFTHYINFENYSGEDLLLIFKQLCEKSKYIIEDQAVKLLGDYLNELSVKHDDNFGNAREIRNIFEGVISKQANRISFSSNITENDLVTIKIEDFDIEIKNSDKDDLNAALAELNSLIGLENVKREINGLIQLVKYQKVRKEQGLPVPDVSLHLVFTGNPGTGKTTVARCISRIYKCLGLVSTGQFVETDRSALVAGYVGQTAIKTKDVIKKAIGGVLFIDEAYTLIGDNGNDYGQEAIDTLLKEMEDHRDNLVVIVAGYIDEMKEFIYSNPGLKSRFNRYIDFEDYDADNMLDIFIALCEKNKYEISAEARELLKIYFSQINACEIGNGRGVRNIFEKIITYQANHFQFTDEFDATSLSLINKQDVEAVLFNM